MEALDLENQTKAIEDEERKEAEDLTVLELDIQQLTIKDVVSNYKLNGEVKKEIELINPN